MCNTHMQLILPWPDICKGEQNTLSKIKNKKSLIKPQFEQTNFFKKWIEGMVCFLPLILVCACEPFSTLWEKKREKKSIVAYMCKC